jgi:hypothetical protein
MDEVGYRVFIVLRIEPTHYSGSGVSPTRNLQIISPTIYKFPWLVLTTNIERALVSLIGATP